MKATQKRDSSAQLRSLYQALLSQKENFEEFKRLLAAYHVRVDDLDNEPPAAAEVRQRLNDRIRSWVGDFDGLDVLQTLEWRAIVVEERFNLPLSRKRAERH